MDSDNAYEIQSLKKTISNLKNLLQRQESSYKMLFSLILKNMYR